jgi:hypothetical protein
VLFLNRHKITSIFTSKKAENTALWGSTLLALGFGLYTYNYMPVKDFLPYHKGANLPEYMTIPKGAPLDEYEINYTLKNQANGETKQMTDKEYIKTEIWKDKNWKIVGTPENKLIKKGFEPRIKDLQIADATGTDYTTEIIENPYYNLVIVAYDLKNASKNAIGNLNALAINSAENYNIKSVLLTSTSPEEAEAYEKQNKLVMEVFYADGVPLKSMVRANPGLILLKDGVVINKWHYHNLPSYQYLEDHYLKNTK